jgi:hypothetical protein
MLVTKSSLMKRARSIDRSTGSTDHNSDSEASITQLAQHSPEGATIPEKLSVLVVDDEQIIALAGW